MIYRSDELEKKSVLHTAERMCVAIRTAPKGRGIDNIVCAVVTGDEKEKLADEMAAISTKEGIAFFGRDAENIRVAEAVVLVGTKIESRGLTQCGYCGLVNCEGRADKGGACAFDLVDLGIAIGSAVSIAADDRVDNRIMFSAGRAALNLGLLGDEAKAAFGIPLIAKGKSIFFDRK